MALTKTKIFLLLISTLAVVALAIFSFKWFHLGRYFEPGKYYITYFDQSVQGLHEDSRVHFRGADIGRVMRVQVAPDNKLIGVVVKLRLKDDITRTSFAQLQGIPATGQVVLAIDHLKPDEKLEPPKLDFKPPYPVIPSKPSDLQKALGGVNVLVEKIEEAGGVGLFDQVKATVKQVEIFFRGDRMESILAKVDATMGHVQNITGRIDKILAAGYVDDVLKESRHTLRTAQQTLQGASQIMTLVENEVKDLNLKEAIGQTRSVTSEIKATSENLRRATQTLNALAERIYQRPPDVFFGKPAPGRFNE